MFKQPTGRQRKSYSSGKWEADRGMWVQGGSGGFSISMLGLFQSYLRPFCLWKYSASYCFGVHWGGDRERNLTSSSVELCIGSYGELVNWYLRKALLPQANLSHWKGLLAKAWARLTFSTIGAWWYLCILIIKPKSTSLCVTYTAEKMELRWLEKGMMQLWQEREVNSIHLELCTKCLSNIWVQNQTTLANSPLQNINTHFNRHL